jgi:hypothetical protein
VRCGEEAASALVEGINPDLQFTKLFVNSGAVPLHRLRQHSSCPLHHVFGVICAHDCIDAIIRADA